MTEMTFREYHELLMEKTRGNDIKEKLETIKRNLDNNEEVQKSDLDSIRDTSSKISSNKHNLEIIKAIFDKNLYTDEEKKTILNNLKNRKGITEYQKAAFEEVFGNNKDEPEVKDQPVVKGGSEVKNQPEEIQDVTSDYQWLFNKYSDKIVLAASNIKGISSFNDLKNNKEILKLLLISEIIGQKHLRTFEEAQEKDFTPPFILFENEKYYLRLQGGSNKEKRSISIFADNNSKTRISKAPDKLENFVRALNDLHQKASNAIKFRTRMSNYIDKKVRDGIDINDNTEISIIRDINNGEVENKIEDDETLKGGTSGEIKDDETLKGGTSGEIKKDESGSDGGTTRKYIPSSERRKNPNLIRCSDLKASDDYDMIENAIFNTFGEPSKGEPGSVFKLALERAKKARDRMSKEETDANARRKDTYDNNSIKKYSSIKVESYSPVLNELKNNPLLREQREILNEFSLGRISRNSKFAKRNWEKNIGDDDGENGNLKAYQVKMYNKAMKIAAELKKETSGVFNRNDNIAKLAKLESTYSNTMYSKVTKMIKANDYNILGDIIQAGKDFKEGLVKNANTDFENTGYYKVRASEEGELLASITAEKINGLKDDDKVIVSYLCQNPLVIISDALGNTDATKRIMNIIHTSFWKDIRRDVLPHFLKKIQEKAKEENLVTFLKLGMPNDSESDKRFAKAMGLDEEKLNKAKKDAKTKEKEEAKNKEEANNGEDVPEGKGAYSEEAKELREKILKLNSLEEIEKAKDEGINDEIEKLKSNNESEGSIIERVFNQRYTYFLEKEGKENNKEREAENKTRNEAEYIEKVKSFKTEMHEADKPKDFENNLTRLNELQKKLEKDFSGDERAQSKLGEELKERISNNSNLKNQVSSARLDSLNKISSLREAIAHFKTMKNIFKNEEYLRRALEMTMVSTKEGDVTKFTRIMSLNKVDAGNYLRYLQRLTNIKDFDNGRIDDNYSLDNNSESNNDEDKTKNLEDKTKSLEDKTNNIEDKTNDISDVINVINNFNTKKDKIDDIAKDAIKNKNRKIAEVLFVNNNTKRNGSGFWKFGFQSENDRGKIFKFLNKKNQDFLTNFNKAIEGKETKDIPLPNWSGKVARIEKGFSKGIVDAAPVAKGTPDTNAAPVAKDAPVAKGTPDTNAAPETPQEKKKKNSILSFFNGLKKSALQKNIARMQDKLNNNKDAGWNNDAKNIEKIANMQSKLQSYSSVLTFEDNFLVCVPLLEDDEQQDQEVQVRTADAEKAVLMALSMDQQTSAQGKKWIVDNMYKGNPEAEKLVDEFIKQNTKDRAKADQALRGNQKVAPGPGGNPAGQQPQQNGQQNGQQPNANQPQQQAQPNPNSQQQPVATNPAAPAMPQQAMANQQQPKTNGAPAQATVTTAAADGYPNRLYKKLIRRKIGM